MPGPASADGADAFPRYELTDEEFRQPFTDFVASVEARHPRGSLAAFVAVPPAGWAPCSLDNASVDALVLQHPIRQNAFGGRGVYRQVHVEQRSMNVKRFRELSQHERNRPPNKSDEELARQFWRSVELNPPLYGADLPMSLFDENLPYGWNLRSLGGCLLQQKRVPTIPGVTAPMCYIGSWRANFAWHTEDADLYSINYLHTGAPKAWYCVPPSARARFQSMAASYFPQLAQGCPSFLRHKDIVLSPSVLHQHGIPFTTTVQRPGEFVVITAGAYHCGFNHGFNIAEAVNFATPAWPELGRGARRCMCSPDAVCIDMRLFGGDAGSGSDVRDGAASEDASASVSDADEVAGAARHTAAVGDIVAVVGEDAARKRYMYLGRVLGAGEEPGCMRLEWLQRDEDGLYRVAPSDAWEEEETALVTAIRYERVAGTPGGKPEGIRLRTPVASLLAARLVADEPSPRAKKARAD